MGSDPKNINASLNCVKILHTLTIVLMICISIALVIIGGYLISSLRSNDFTTNYNYIVVPIIILCLGFATIFVCLLGIYGRKTDNICMLKLYASFSFIVLVVEICIALAAAVLRNNLDKYAVAAINDMMDNYGNNTEASGLMDRIQEQFYCCGSNSAIDYRNLNLSIPISCCSQSPCMDQYIFPKGCGGVLTGYFDHKMLLLSISSFVASTVNAFAFAFALLYVRDLNRYTPIK